MLAQDNSLQTVKRYFKENLSKKFSANEIRMISNQFIQERLKLSDTELMLLRDVHFSDSDVDFFKMIVTKLLNDEPFQYLIGNTEFYGVKLKIDKRALIPRPETEELVDWLIRDFEKDTTGSIADFCSGSGCIALAIKNKLKNAQIFAFEKSPNAIELINENSRNLQLKLNIIESDLLEDELSETVQFDAIISNPPYIPMEDKKRMAKNVLEFEPEMALFVEDNEPLVFYTRILTLGKTLLKPQGKLYFEIHESYGQQIVEELIRNGYQQVELKKDLQGKDRMIKATKGNQ